MKLPGVKNKFTVQVIGTLKAAHCYCQNCAHHPMLTLYSVSMLLHKQLHRTQFPSSKSHRKQNPHPGNLTARDLRLPFLSPGFQHTSGPSWGGGYRVLALRSWHCSFLEMSCTSVSAPCAVCLVTSKYLQCQCHVVF